MQLVINASETAITREQQLFSGKNFHVFVYDKTENISRLHRHNYYEFTLVLTERYFQETNGKCMLLEWGDFASTPLGLHHQSFYESGITRILDVGISKHFFEQYYLSLLLYCFVASQVYRTNNTFLTYVETMISPLNFREIGLEEPVRMITLYVINHLRYYRKEQVTDDIPQWLKNTVEKVHGKEQLSESALENVVTLSAKSQEYLTRATQRYYGKTSMQIVNEIRINFARKQLEMTDYSVTDTAFKVGYSSPSLFTKAFKKLTSFTPKSYREKSTEFSQ